jgi:fatty acid desaturase
MTIVTKPKKTLIPMIKKHAERTIFITLSFFLSGLITWTLLLFSAHHPNILATCIVTVLTTITILYSFLPVSHEAVHGNISTHRGLNETVGSISLLFVSPLGSLSVLRYAHFQHHKTPSKHPDPDLWCTQGPIWLLPLKWFTLDIKYTHFYWANKKMKAPYVYYLTAVLLTIGLLINAGYLQALLLHWLIPGRMVVFFFAFLFGYLTHSPAHINPSGDSYQVALNRIGYDTLLTLLMGCHNYHIEHHLKPHIPFYDMRKHWKKYEKERLAHNPILVTAFGNPLHSS